MATTDHGPTDHGPTDHGPASHGPGNHGPGDHAGPGRRVSHPLVPRILDVARIEPLSPRMVRRATGAAGSPAPTTRPAALSSGPGGPPCLDQQRRQLRYEPVEPRVSGSPCSRARSSSRTAVMGNLGAAWRATCTIQLRVTVVPQ